MSLRNTENAGAVVSCLMLQKRSVLGQRKELASVMATRGHTGSVPSGAYTTTKRRLKKIIGISMSTSSRNASKGNTRLRQSKLESMTEVAANIASGFVVSYCVWLFVVPLFYPEHNSPPGEAFGIVMIFTVTSVIRSYFWRRLFEREVHRLLMRLFGLTND